jgi:hypothetical protein
MTEPKPSGDQADKFQALRDALAYAKFTGGVGISADVAAITALLADLDAAVGALDWVVQIHEDQTLAQERDFELWGPSAKSVLSQIKAAGRCQA